MTAITVYHNPKCGTSRNTLAMIRNSGVEPEVIEYLKTPPDRATLVALIAATGEPVINAVRTKEAIFTELQLDAPGVTDAQLIDAMLQHPILINRPIVVTPLGTRLCRPSEKVLDILPAPPRAPPRARRPPPPRGPGARRGPAQPRAWPSPSSLPARLAAPMARDLG